MMQTYNISLNKELAELVEKQVKSGCFSNRSEFFRQLLREAFFSDKDWIYEEPYISELKERIDSFEEDKKSLIPLEEID